MQIKILNSAFDGTEVQETSLPVVQVECNHLDRSQDVKTESFIHIYISSRNGRKT